MSFITQYNSKIGLKLMLLLPVLVILLLIGSNFQPDIENPVAILALLLWVILFLNSLLVSFGGFSLSRGFSSEVTKQKSAGFPIESLDGFPETKSSIRTVFSSSFFITIVVLISLVTYVLLFVIESQIKQDSSLETLVPSWLRLTVVFVALGLILIAIGIALLLSLPDKPALVPGALMKYFYPNKIPTQVDNFLGDTISSFLDPITRLRWDEWSESISQGLAENYLIEKSQSDRLAVAREKILLFAYLNLTMPKLVNDYIVNSELGELFSSQDLLQDVLDGKGSDISWEILKNIIKEVQGEAPEIFTIVDRLIVELKDNLKNFKDSDLWVSVAVPNKVSGNRNPFRLMVFMLNKSKEFTDKKRPVNVKLINYDVGNNSTLPDNYHIFLDEAEGLAITADELPFISDQQTDIVGVVSSILQVGDAVWFQIYKSRFGYHIYNIRVEEEGKGSVFGSSMKIQLARDLLFYFQQYGGKLSALGGAIIPVVGFLLSYMNILK
jgi:hypothetical protein